MAESPIERLPLPPLPPLPLQGPWDDTPMPGPDSSQIQPIPGSPGWYLLPEMQWDRGMVIPQDIPPGYDRNELPANPLDPTLPVPLARA